MFFTGSWLLAVDYTQETVQLDVEFQFEQRFHFLRSSVYNCIYINDSASNMSIKCP